MGEAVDSRFIDFFSGPSAESQEAEGGESEEVDATEAPAEKMTDSGKDFFADSKRSKAEEDSEEESEEEDAEEEEPSEEETEEAGEEEKPEEKPKEEAKKPEKYIKVKSSEGTVKMPVDAVMEVSANGEKKAVTLHELRESYSSKQANLTEYRRLRDEKQNLEKEKADLYFENERVQEIDQGFEKIVVDLREKVEKGQSLEALGDLFTATGKDALPLIRKMRDDLAQVGVWWSSLTDEQKEIYLQSEELAYNKRKWEKDRETESSLAMQKKAREELEQVVKDLNTDWPTVRALAKELKDLKAQGKYPHEVNPKAIKELYNLKQEVNYLGNLIKEVDPSLVTDKELWNKLRQAKALYSPTKEQLVAAIRHYGSAASDTQDTAKKDKPKSSFKQQSQKSAANKPKNKADLFF